MIKRLADSERFQMHKNKENQTSKNDIPDFDSHFRRYHELMQHKIREILLVAGLYDAYIMEEDGSLTSRIINEYRGLNLSRPPRVTHVSTGKGALEAIERDKFDMVIVMPNLEDMSPRSLIFSIKAFAPGIPVIFLAHSDVDLFPIDDDGTCAMVDNQFIWLGDSDILLALVKSVEDRLNVDADTAGAMVRVLILVEDSPLYRSYFLPLLYRVVVRQTQRVIEESINEDHRLLKMRARPKILLADNYEDALNLFHRYQSYVFGVISDTRFPRNCRVRADAGVNLLSVIKRRIGHLPLLLMSSETENRELAKALGVVFMDKNLPDLVFRIEAFFKKYLGFGDFVFRDRQKKQVMTATDLQELEAALKVIPDEPIYYHAVRNHFSNWIMARSEISLALKLREMSLTTIDDVPAVRKQLVSSIHELRKWRQKGVVVQFDEKRFDPDVSDFVKIGQGEIGGKARGVAFIAHLLRNVPAIRSAYPDVDIDIPKTVVIATDAFNTFIEQNRLGNASQSDEFDQSVIRRFLKASMPQKIKNNLAVFLSRVNVPLSVRSSSIMEDAHFQPLAGIYRTCMIPNNHPDLSVRLEQLIHAIKIVYASTWFRRSRNFFQSISRRFQSDKMAVMIQHIVGKQYGRYYYPTLSGLATSLDYYPVPPVKTDDGMVKMVLGMGKTIEKEFNVMRFSPRFPKMLPQFSKIEDILQNAQRHFYALDLSTQPGRSGFLQGGDLCRRDPAEAETEYPVRIMSSTYVPEEHRIRDVPFMHGHKILTFAQVLKYDLFPLPDLVNDILDLGKRAMGCPIEIEFAVNLNEKKEDGKDAFFLLQIRPVSANTIREQMHINGSDIDRAFCYSTSSLGNGILNHLEDIVYVPPDLFRKEKTDRIAGDISRVNAALASEKRPYVLLGPGRWGSSDPWLGIPVRWPDISAVKVMIELRNTMINADPSWGSHFFQQITHSGIHYLTLSQNGDDFIDMEWLSDQPIIQETSFIRHIRTLQPFKIKNDGTRSQCVIFKNQN